MKKDSTLLIVLHCFIGIFLLSYTLPLIAQGQDVIYLVDETPIKGDIEEVTAKKVKYKKASGQVRSIDAEQVTMVFNEVGRFLLFPPVQLTSEAANDFITSATKPTLDMLITLNKQVISGIIISANENEVLYQDAQQQKNERSIGKDILALIIFKNGQHELLVSPSQASEILYATKDSIEKLNKQSIISNTAEKKPVANSQNELNKNPNNSKPVDTSAGAATQRKEEELPKTGPKATHSAEPVIPEEKLTELKGLALKKVQELSSYIKVLSNAQTDAVKAKKTIELACALFVDEDARVEVSNIRTGVKNKYKIRDYLNRLTKPTIQYEKIDIDYANINYAADLEEKPDGNYLRQIEYMQTYKGFGSGNILYEDMRKLKASVNQKLIKKGDASTSRQEWDVFLSDIGVIETQKF